MSAIIAELDDMDAATADMTIKLQLLDIHTSAQADGVVEDAGQWDNVIAMQEYEAELRAYRTRRGLPSDELPVPEPEKPVEGEGEVEGEIDAGPAAVHDHTHIPLGLCLICSDRRPLAELYDCSCPPDPTPHRWCSNCLEQLHRAALTDETLYPPRCCQHIFNFDLVKVYLTRNLVQDFEAKKEELDDTNRIYCHVSTCSAYIGAEHREGTLAHCPNEHRPTCILCKNAKHDGGCEEDTGRRQVEETAAQKGWQTCSSCKAVVELNAGCNHITSATSAVQPGRHATVPSGTSVASSTVPSLFSSMKVVQLETSRPSPLWPGIFAATTAVKAIIAGNA
ncbi:hypothetical protein M409DRAFT_29451 [Zasmidium cellare ATCC 36951]|uniref:IBR domain-containing protein n=1 Tax=Zasmidium cellare ATCC 36951 TaxID=1080233 RepID=A0A6A6C435_ZASCE|nr:uncharacterized protein M409DRAFT_29451 [Zasmidium cellare ATCC 36951]KAF2160156.1 hypothetical protein M409DRAFT_29451 [Zasmidium cellare ATCC 36951]